MSRRGEMAIKVITAISRGSFDDYLGEISATVQNRNRVLADTRAAANMISLKKPGTKVRIGRISPRYLEGLEGKIVSRPATHPPGKGILYVDIERTVGTSRRAYGPVLGIPASCLEPVKGE